MNEPSAQHDDTLVACPVSVRAQSAPADLAIMTQGGGVGFGELEWMAWSAKNHFADIAPRPREGVVALGVPVDATACAVLLGLLRRGHVVCLLDPKLPAAYAEARCTGVGAQMRLLPGVPEALESLPRPRAPRVVLEGPPHRYHPHRPAVIVFTSGSSGRPKAAALSMGNLLAAARMANHNLPLVSGDGWLLSLGIHHVAGLGILFRCWMAGAAVVVPAPEASLAEAILDPRVTHLSLVPTQLHRLMASTAARERLRDMKAILIGGAPIPEGLIQRTCEARLPIHTSYGMTETCAQICATPPGASRDLLLTSGRPLIPHTVRISPAGEIEVGGAARFLGYWENGRLVQPFTGDGWFRTGDLGRMDAHDCLTVTGRRDNMFIAGGENIQPEEVEAALCALPGVAEAVVVPVAHEAFGATPAAFLRMEGGNAPDGEALRAALLQTLPKFKVPRYWFPWPGDLAQGMKVNRQALAEKAHRTVAAMPRQPD